MTCLTCDVWRIRARHLAGKTSIERHERTRSERRPSARKPPAHASNYARLADGSSGWQPFSRICYLLERAFR